MTKKIFNNFVKKNSLEISKSSQKPLFQFGQVQRKGPIIAENTSLPVGKHYFNFRTKESSINTVIYIAFLTLYILFCTRKKHLFLFAVAVGMGYMKRNVARFYPYQTYSRHEFFRDF